MIKALLRKEFAQIKAMYLTNKRKGRQGGKGMFIFLIIMYFVEMLSMAALDWAFAQALIPEGFGWLYYTFVGAMGFLAGVISVELLSKVKILLVRMIGVYIMGFIYEMLIMLPGLILYFIYAGITPLNFLFGIIGAILIGFLIMIFSCFFGWLVAIITAKLKNKNILTVIIGVIFIGLFIYLRFKANAFFRDLIINAVAIAESLEGWGYPIYAAGLGMTGNVPAMLIFLGVTGVLFGLTYWIISRSFNKIVNIKPSEKKASFKEDQIKTASVKKALFRKEIKRFTSSPNYMLNCGLGILFIVAAIVLILIGTGSVREAAAAIGGSFPGGAGFAGIIGAFAVCLLAGFTNIAAPSVSLEGPFIWIIPAMPVNPADILMAKLKMAVLLPVIPAAVCALVLQLVLGSSIPMIILSVICAVLFVILCAMLGMRFDLAKPFLNWTNEVQPVKQSMAVLFSMLFGMISPFVPAAIYLILAPVVAPEIYLAVWIVIMAVFSFLLYKWINNKGAKKFAVLGQ